MKRLLLLSLVLFTISCNHAQIQSAKVDTVKWEHISGIVHAVKQEYSSWDGWHRSFIVEDTNHYQHIFDNPCTTLPVWENEEVEFEYSTSEEFNCSEFRNVKRLQ